MKKWAEATTDATTAPTLLCVRFKGFDNWRPIGGLYSNDFPSGRSSWRRRCGCGNCCRNSRCRRSASCRLNCGFRSSYLSRGGGDRSHRLASLCFAAGFTCSRSHRSRIRRWGGTRYGLWLSRCSSTGAKKEQPDQGKGGCLNSFHSAEGNQLPHWFVGLIRGIKSIR